MHSKLQKDVEDEATIIIAELIIQTSIKTSRKWKQTYSVQVYLWGPISFKSERKFDSSPILHIETLTQISYSW